jgi:hypothetical protein
MALLLVSNAVYTMIDVSISLAGNYIYPGIAIQGDTVYLTRIGTVDVNMSVQYRRKAVFPTN